MRKRSMSSTGSKAQSLPMLRCVNPRTECRDSQLKNVSRDSFKSDHSNEWNPHGPGFSSSSRSKSLGKSNLSIHSLTKNTFKDITTENKHKNMKINSFPKSNYYSNPLFSIPINDEEQKKEFYMNNKVISNDKPDVNITLVQETQEELPFRCTTMCLNN